MFVVHRFASLVLDCGASLRCAAGVLGLFRVANPKGRVADWTTGRLWLLGIGLAALRRPLVIADDWVWLVDHSIQIGQTQCLLILGIRLRVLPVGRPLSHEDMEPVALIPMSHSTQVTVAEQLGKAVSRTGVPRAILSDRGSDLHGGVEIFRPSHHQTIALQDVKHKAACLLKARLENDQRWRQYTAQAGQAKFAVLQTELAFLAAPSPRPKARFLNLSGLVQWGRQTRKWVDEPSALLGLGVTEGRWREKLGWLESYREPLEEWSAWHEMIERTLDFVRKQGYFVRAGLKLGAALPEASGSTEELREQLIGFVRGESAKAEVGERLPGSTEVVESCFGKLKALERDQSKSGFTGLLLSLGAMVSQRSLESIGLGLERYRVGEVGAWCQETLGPSVRSKRKQACRQLSGATKTG